MHTSCVHEYCPLSLLGSPTSAVRQGGHFHITNEDTEAWRQILSGLARRKPGSLHSLPNAILLVVSRVEP